MECFANLVPGFYAGTVSGIIQVIVGHPLDSMKVWKQANNKFHGIENRYQIRHLYRGVSYPLFSSGLINGIIYGTNWSLTRSLDNQWITGALTGLTVSVFMSPFERYKIADQMGKQGLLTIPKSSQDLQAVIKDAYRGYLSTLAREVISCSLYFGLYEKMRTQDIPIIIAGGLSGLTSTFLVHPIDSIKTRLQTNTTLSVQKSISIGNLWDGLGISLIRSSIVNAIGFATFEFALSKYPF